MNIVFLDIDGPMIPARALFMQEQTEGYPTRFDPCAVGLLNELCKRADAKIVIHSHWRKSFWHLENVPDIKKHLIEQGISEEHFHDVHLCPRKLTSDRWHDINMWVDDCDEDIDGFVILEDEEPHEHFRHIHNLVAIDYDEGFTFERFNAALKVLGQPPISLTLI